MTSADPNPESLEEFWDQEWEDTGADGDDAMSRRKLLGAAGTLLGLGTMLGGGLLFSTGRASAHVASSGLSINGDTTTTDGGQLSSLTVSTDGHVSYDGLDTDAASININFFAAESGNSVDVSGHRIAQQQVSIGSTTGLDTRAGHYDYSFVDVNMLNSDDLSVTDFTATTDGGSNATDVDFRVELEVLDSGGAKLVEGASTATATVTVNNQARSGNSQGSGNVTASGSNQNA